MQSPDLSFVVPSISRDMRALYEAHFPFVWRYMAHRGAPQTSLDDLVHSVFRIVREHPSRRDPSRPRSVVVCMISRQVLREYKKRNANVEQHDPLQDGEGEGPTRTFSRDAPTQMLDATLDNLTEMQREVFLLCAGEKMSARDVGDALGVPESTVELRLKSAHQRVASFIERLRAHPMWEGMTDLSPKGLLDAAQIARTPGDRDRERIFAAMLASSMTSAPPPVQLLSLPSTQPQAAQPNVRIPPPPRMPRPMPELETQTIAPPRPYLSWAAAALVAITMGTTSYFAIAKRNPEPEALRADATPITTTTVQPEAVLPRVQQAPPAAEPDPAPAAATEKETEATPQPATTPRSRRARRSTHRDAPAAAPRSDNRGARQLFAAERALRSGEPRVALELVREHASRYPDSELGTERNALRAQILCDLGRTRAARRVVLELEADHAEQPLLASVDQACMGPD